MTRPTFELSVLSALGCIATPAYAQQATAPVEITVQEVIVTALKRKQDIQKVGASVQALTADALAEAGIDDVTRLEQISPGLVFAKSGNDAKLAIRGANSNATFADNTSIVGVFVDGVYRPRASQQTRSFFDVERVEILKGPQGTLYGRNTLGGAINLYTNAPSFKKEGLSFGLTSTYARFNDFRNEWFVNSKLSEHAAVRLAVVSERSDGWIANLVGRNLGIKDNVAVRASALWDITDNLTALVRFTNVSEDGNPGGMFAIAGACRAVTQSGLTDPRGAVRDCKNPRRGSGGTRAFDSYGNLRTVERDFVNDDALREKNATVELNADFGAVTLKSITSYTNYKAILGNDADYSSNPHAREWVKEKNKSITQELLLSSRTGTPLQWTSGLYASKDDLFFSYSSLRHTLDDLSVRTNIVSSNGVSLPRLIGTPVLSNATVINNPSNNTQFIESKVYGVFGQASYELVKEWRVIGGLRYSRETKHAINGNAPFLGSLTPSVVPSTPSNFDWDPNTATARSDVSKTFENTTWRASTEYDVSKDMMVYATAATGFLSGVMNQNGTVTLPQKSRSYEAGLKSRFLNNRVQLNAALYQAEYSDLATTFQIPNPASPGSVLTLSSNGGTIKAKGLELSLDVVPLEALRISAGAAFMHAQYGKFGLNLPQQVLDGVAPVTAANRFVDLSGQRPPYTPKFTFSLSASYGLRVAGGTLTPLMRFRYSDSYSAAGGLPFDPAGFQPSFTQTDLRLMWKPTEGNWSIEAFVENIEDEMINQRTQHGGDGIEQANYGFPRNYGARFKLSF
ncbi:MAG: TonB-dependent receptor [Rubrivivax sp.]